MPDNPQAISGPLLALPGHGLLRLSGRDAIAFAQAQFMNDVAALAGGDWQWNGWLGPKGRVIALFALLKVDEGTLWLLVPDADAGALADALRRFVFRSKVMPDVAADLSVSGAFSPPLSAHGPRSARLGDGSIEFDMGGEGGARRLLVSPAPPAAATDGGPAWRDADLAHGLPRLAPSQVERWTPQQLSLERLRAFSVRKGCYPGQEIVARTHFLGKAKRGLALFDADGAVEVGAEIMQEGRGIGEIVAVSGDARRLLAVLPQDLDDAPLSAGDAQLRRGALLGGLAR